MATKRASTRPISTPPTSCTAVEMSADQPVTRSITGSASGPELDRRSSEMPYQVRYTPVTVSSAPARRPA